ncbi:MAG TPA: alpha/beta hydrolase [Longimicrobiaceae bacterium]|nr:alpha/beta hydrolase [Longimicrobiaceae bacterium]
MTDTEKASAPLLNHTRVTAGEDEPKLWLLVLHGIYGAGRNWGSIARRLVEARPEWGVLLVDLRLHGDSQDFTGPHTLEAAAGDVNELVRRLDFHAATVLGHSFGGKVALMYAREHGDELKQVWVVDSTVSVREPSGSAWEMIEAVRSMPAEFPSRKEAVAGLEERGYQKAVGQWMAMNLEPSDGKYRWRLDFDGIEEMLEDYFRTDLWDVLEDPPEGVAVHVVKATRSNAITEDDIERMEAAAEKGAAFHLHEVEGGHWLNTDNPDAVLELLAAQLP